MANIGAPAPSFGYRDPMTPPPKAEGGDWKWDVAKGIWNFVKNNAGDALTTAGGIIEGYMSSADRAKQLAELARQYDQNFKQRQSEFDRNFGEEQAGRSDTEAQAAVRAQTQLNTAPMADNAQALLMKRMGVSPGQFQGRDLTKGPQDLLRDPTNPSANVTSAMQDAAANYQPGQGGVDTSTIRMLLDKMKLGGFGAQKPSVSPDPTTTPPDTDYPTGRAPRPPIPPGTKRFPPPLTLRPPVSDVPPDENPDPDDPYADPVGTGFRRRMGY